MSRDFQELPSHSFSLYVTAIQNLHEKDRLDLNIVVNAVSLMSHLY